MPLRHGAVLTVEGIMAAGVKHYFEDGTEYKGATHKTNGQLMSGKTHTASSKNLVHSPGKKAAKKPMKAMATYQ